MKPFLWIAAFAATSFGVAAAQEAEHPPHWGYSGEVGPEHWAEFESDFGACSSGRNQSPIDLRNFIEAELPPIEFDYKPGGHDGRQQRPRHPGQLQPWQQHHHRFHGFALKQFHFHAPSENTINGKSFPLEAHFVHADAKGNLAVVALMFEAGASNKVLEQVWPRVSESEDDEQPLAPQVAAADLLQANRDYYRYSGSLTTPPCSEGVLWLVLKHPAQATREQLERPAQADRSPE